MERRPRGTAFFWGGFLVGIVIAVLVVAGALFHVTSRGLQVTLAIDGLGQYIGKQIESQAARELPLVMEEIKAQVPNLVKKQMQTGNMTAEIKIADINIILPPSALAELDSFLQGTVETTLYRLLEGMELDVLADELGQQAQEMVQRSLVEELGDRQILSIKTWWGTIPVVLDVMNNGGEAKDPGGY